jgi:peptide/nickel transport system permease protein
LIKTKELNDSSPRFSEFKRFRRVFFGRPVVIVGFVIILILIFCAIFAPLISRYDPYENDLNNALKHPSLQHWLGTDELGRDELSRIIYGSRISLQVGIIAVCVASVIGITLGALSGYFGGWVDMLIMRIIDSMMAIPSLVLALVFAAMLGGGLKNIMIAVGISMVPSYCRLMRSQVLAVKQQEFITSARSIGSNDWRIIIKHVFPNSFSPLLVLITMNLGTAILSEAGLSFIGIGIAPPGAAWGSMVSYGYKFLNHNQILSFAPGICIMLVVLSFNMVGDGLRDALDPRLRGTL